MIQLRIRLDITTGFVYLMIALLVFLFSSIIFELLWIVFRYNLLYITVFKSDRKGFLYSTILNQLFMGIYVMKFYFVNFFLLMRNIHHHLICVDQTMIMIIITAMILVFQFALNELFGFCFQFFFGVDLWDKFKPKNQKTMSSNCNSILKCLFFFSRRI